MPKFSVKLRTDITTAGKEPPLLVFLSVPILHVYRFGSGRLPSLLIMRLECAP